MSAHVASAFVSAQFIFHSFQFEVVNKRATLTELDSTIGEGDPIPENIFKRISKVGLGCAVFRCLQLTILTRRRSSVLASLAKRDA